MVLINWAISQASYRSVGTFDAPVWKSLEYNHDARVADTYRMNA